MNGLAALGVLFLAVGECFSWWRWKTSNVWFIVSFSTNLVTTASPLARNVDVDSPLVEVENVKTDDPAHRWMLVPDGDGRMHLIDFNSYQTEPAPFFNADNDVLLILFTQRNRNSGQRLTFDANAIRNTAFNSGAPTRFVIHGWNNDGNSAVNTQITDGYLNRGDFNVVSDSWAETEMRHKSN